MRLILRSVLSLSCLALTANADVFRGEIALENPVLQGKIQAEVWIDSTQLKNVKYSAGSSVIVTELGSAPCQDCDSPAIAWACQGSLQTKWPSRIDMDYKMILNNTLSLYNARKSIFPAYRGHIELAREVLTQEQTSCHVDMPHEKIISAAASATPLFVNADMTRIDIDPVLGKFCYISTTFGNPKLANPLQFVEGTSENDWILEGLEGNRFSQIQVNVQATCYTGRFTNENLGHLEFFRTNNSSVLYIEQ